MLSPFEEHTQRPLPEHLAEFEQSLKDAGNTEAYRKLVATHAKTVIENAGFRFIRDISASKVQQSLADLKKTGKKKKSQQTINHYLGAIKPFSRGLLRDHLTDQDRLIILEGGNVLTDRRIERRELSEVEIQYLLNAGKSGKALTKMMGFQRFRLYTTALSTGLRAAELASLTPAHFDLAADVPIVRINAENEKARRGDVIPLPTGLVEMLRPWFHGMLKKALLWPGKWASPKRTGKTMQLDLENAQVQWMTPLPLTTCTGQTTQPNGSTGQSLVAVMVAGFPGNHSGSVRTAEDRPPTNEPVEPENTDSRNPCQRKTLDKDCGCLSAIDKAERQGFEPWVPLRVLRFSRPVRSAALPSLRVECY